MRGWADLGRMAEQLIVKVGDPAVADDKNSDGGGGSVIVTAPRDKTTLPTSLGL